MTNPTFKYIKNEALDDNGPDMTKMSYQKEARAKNNF